MNSEINGIWNPKFSITPDCAKTIQGVIYEGKSADLTITHMRLVCNEEVVQSVLVPCEQQIWQVTGRAKLEAVNKDGTVLADIDLGRLTSFDTVKAAITEQRINFKEEQ